MPSPGVYAFEAIGPDLPFIPLAGRRALDVLGRKLSLEGWLSLPLAQRERVCLAGAGSTVDPSAVHVVDSALPAPQPMAPATDPDASSPPLVLAAALGAGRPLEPGRWRALRPLDRYALTKYAARPEKVAQAYDEILGATVPAAAAVPALTHLGPTGEARMVGVGDKAETARRAVASARVRTTRETVQAIAAGAVAKGDVLAVARVAGIQAAKRTPELVPLCHPVRTTHASVDIELDAANGEVRVRATVEAIDRTGVEMEAMTAASIAALTVYDMIKSVDRWATVEGLRLEAKSGGKSGDVVRPGERS